MCDENIISGIEPRYVYTFQGLIVNNLIADVLAVLVYNVYII